MILILKNFFFLQNQAKIKGEEEDWQLWETVDTNRTKATMNVQKGKSYQFRVIAINRAGKSDPSHPSRSKEAQPSSCKFILLFVLILYYLIVVFAYIWVKIILLIVCICTLCQQMIYTPSTQTIVKSGILRKAFWVGFDKLGPYRSLSVRTYSDLHKNWPFANFQKIGVAASWVNIKVCSKPHLKAFTAIFKLMK